MGTRMSWMQKRVVAGAIALLVVLGAFPPIPARASDAQDASHLVTQAQLTLDSFLADPQMGPPLQSLLKRAHGVLIFPQVLEGAFLVGAAGGSGVLLVRANPHASWQGPAFYTLGQGSFGLQAGGEASEMVLVALTDRGVSALLSTSAKLGGDAGVAIGPVGAGASAATENLSADLISYTRNKGLYAGVALDGAVVAVRTDLNTAFYGRPLTPTQILVQHEGHNAQAAQLLDAVARGAAKQG